MKKIVTLLMVSALALGMGSTIFAAKTRSLVQDKPFVQNELFEDSKNGNLSRIALNIYLDLGANIDDQDQDGYTALMWAARNEHLHPVKVLLDEGANTQLKNNEGLTALDLAKKSKNTEIIDALQKVESKKIAQIKLFKLSKSGILNPEFLKIELKAGADINKQDEDGYTPLMWAALKGHKISVMALLDAEANIQLKNNENLTALDLAKNTGIIDALQKAEAKRIAQIKLFKLSKSGILNPKFLQIELKAGADINKQDEDGYTPLMWAVRNGHINSVMALLNAKDAKADTLLKNKEGLTALDLALISRNKEIARLLF